MRASIKENPRHESEAERMLNGNLAPEVIDEFARVRAELLRQGRESLIQPIPIIGDSHDPSK